MFQPKAFTRYCYRMVLTVVGTLCIVAAHAQLTANFTADKTGGCPPGLQVKFTNTTTGTSAATTYRWDFGNGRTSVEKDPSSLFTDVKAYTVTLTVKDGAATSTKSMTVTVYKLPSVDFTIQNTRGCTPLSVNFTANAVGYDGATISSYLWDFGDGITQQTSASTVSHLYNGQRNPAVTVTVTDNHGCVNISDVKTSIQVLTAVNAAFTADKTVLCTPADKVTFNNQSTGPGTLSYAWDFGDNTASTERSPAHTYSANGDYKVKLTVTSSEGCSGTYEMSKVSVGGVKADFTTPALICTGTYASFYSTSSQSPDYLFWNFGDGGTASGISGSHTYTQSGNFDITLTARYGTCEVSAKKQVKVNQSPSSPGFVVENNGACGAPAVITLKDTTKGATKWLWYVNSTLAGTAQNTTYTFNYNGWNSIALTVTDAAGCSANIPGKTIELRAITANIEMVSSTSPYGLRGCDNFTVKLKASSSTDVIASYQWNFGDGGTSTDKEPSHNFTKAGFYTVTLAFVTDKGCKGSSTTLVSVYKTPEVDFNKVNANPVCGNTPVLFHATSPVTVDTWLWNFEGLNSAAYNYGPDPSYQYSQQGVYTVRLIAVNGVCRDTVVKTNYVEVVPPFPKANTPQNTCNGMRNLVTFIESSRQATEWRWDFGDGNTTSYTSYRSSVPHEYAKTGKYKVVLTAVNGQCAVKDSVTAYVMLKQTPDLSVDKPEICGHDNVRITVTNNDVNPYYPNNVFQFTVNTIQYDKYGDRFTGSGLPGLTANPSYSGSLSGLIPGKDSIRAITTTSYFGCNDTTAFVKLKVKGPTAAYTFTANNVCYNTPNKFLEKSLLTDNVPIVLWTWTYGDGVTESYTKGPEASHIYANPGSYYPSLKVTDKDGCYNTVSQYAANAPAAVVTGPKADFTWSPTIVKPGNTVYYYNTSSYASNATYTWSFSYDGSTSTLTGPSKYYDKIAVDVVKLVAKNTSNGCVDSITKKISINNIHAAFSYTATYINGNSCPPVLARFTNQSTDYTRVSWNFGDQATADNLNTPTHTYNRPGKYTIKIYAYDDKGGVDSADQQIEIKGPYSSFVADKAQVCGVPATIHFTADPLNVTSFSWDFADGTVATSVGLDTSYTYKLPGAYKPAIIVKDAAGCSAVFELSEPFVIDTLHISFSKTPAIICDSADVLFTPTVVNIGADELKLPLTYHWDFGTGNPEDTSNAAYPVFRYKGAGGEQFKAHLTVQSYAGCIEEDEILVDIQRKTRGSIAAVPEICQYETAAFKGTADGPVDSWKWELADNGAVVAGKTEAAHQYNTGGDYKVLLLLESKGCIDTATHLLTVHTLPDAALAARNELLCLGDSVVLTAHNAVKYEWTPATAITDAGIADPAVFPVVNTKYKVKLTDQYGCVNTDSVQITLSYPFTITTLKDTAVCKGDQVQLFAGGAVSYKWIEGNYLNNAGIGNAVATAVSSNHYTVVGYGSDACFTDTAGFAMTVNPVPAVTTIADTVLIAGFSIPLTTKGSSDVIRYAWSPGFNLDCSNCVSPVSTPRQHSRYVVTAFNQYGCMARDTVNITLRCVGSTVFIPNTFTPNKDARNDLFYPRGKGIRLVKSFRIYNRLGEMIFERTNFQLNDVAQGWDGAYMGRPLSNSVFTYTSEMICDAGDLFVLNGTVTLLR